MQLRPHVPTTACGEPSHRLHESPSETQHAVSRIIRDHGIASVQPVDEIGQARDGDVAHMRRIERMEAEEKGEDESD